MVIKTKGFIMKVTVKVLLASILSFSVIHALNYGAVGVNDGEIIYEIDENAHPSELKALNALKNANHTALEKTFATNTNLRAVTLSKAVGKEESIAKAMKKTGAVKFAEPNYKFQAIATPNDSYLNDQWFHNTLNTFTAWNRTTGSTNILVAVCDTGVDTNHPDLVDNLVLPGYNTYEENTNVEDQQGHGTAVIGSVAATGNNGLGVAGMMWQAKVLPIKITPNAEGYAYLTDMYEAVTYATNKGAKLINVSFGGAGTDTMNSAGKYAKERGSLLFMAAGNSNIDPGYRDYTSFVTVGATDENDNRASFSNWGNYIDVVAPGVSIATTTMGGGYAYVSGTSFSSPITTGLAGLLLSVNPNLTPAEIETTLFTTAVDLGIVGNDTIYGYGRIDAAAAVASVSSVVTNTPPVAVANSNIRSGDAPLTVTFDAAASSDTDGTIVSYMWNFGDGHNATGITTAHTYETGGNYQVTLKVTDNDGANHTDTITIEVTENSANPLVAPTNLTAMVNDNSVTLTWNDVNEIETGYSIERGQKLKGKTQFTQIGAVNTDASTFTDVSLANGEYFYRVAAHNSEGLSEYSNSIKVRIGSKGNKNREKSDKGNNGGGKNNQF
jgi:subtilisin family serine protease